MVKFKKTQKSAKAFMSQLGSVKTIMTEGLELWRAITGTENEIDVLIKTSKRGNLYLVFEDGGEEYFIHSSGDIYDGLSDGSFEEGEVVSMQVRMLEPVPGINEDELIKFYGKDSKAYSNYKSAIRDGEKRIKAIKAL
jgi:hypothetical protein